MPAANTVRTYTNANMIREDLEQQYSMLSPEETPFQTAIGPGEAPTQTYKEWSAVDLLAPDASNRVIEGDAVVAADAPTLGYRMGNYTQISDKVVTVSHTSEKVEAGAENIQRQAKQIVMKLKELKRDMEVMLMSNVVGVAGSDSVARVSAGLPAWLRTNIILGSGGAAPVMSGAPGDVRAGVPDTVLTPGTAVAFTEINLNNIIASCWQNGAEPSIIMVNANNKRVISKTFTGNATRYKDAIDKRLVSAVDIYDSDFGELTVVPNRFQPVTATSNYSVYVLDPNYASVCFLETPRQKELASSGHAKSRLIWTEYTLKIDNEAAHGAIHATTNAAPS